MSIIIGPYRIEGNLFLAPMAGVADSPFRAQCRHFGADYAVGEMVSCQPQLWQSEKSRLRLALDNEPHPRVVQLLGADPLALSAAFVRAKQIGADIVDFNMGCPAKKVCNVACGSALMRDETLAFEIIRALGRASVECELPVTLKCRTGWDRSHKNAVTIAKMAEEAGFAMVTVHGRTRADAYMGEAEYETIARVVESVKIPVVANGDITDANRARAVLNYTKAAAVMIGRGALGRPWVFAEMKAALTGESFHWDWAQKAHAILTHARAHYAYYPPVVAAQTFRKHLLWYLDGFPDFAMVRGPLCQAQTPNEQYALLVKYFQSHGWCLNAEGC